MAKILVGLSGGVDSAVATARLQAAGHEVSGFFMQLESPSRPWSRPVTSAEPVDALADAHRVADFLGVELQVWDLAERFNRVVMDSFVQAYRDGLTPNPCVHCNRFIKFGYVIERARREGFDYVATGHYARLWRPGQVGLIPVGVPPTVAEGAFPDFALLRGSAIGKDQSYVLAGARAEALARAVFPLGDVTDKAATRAEAEALGIPVAGKRDSFDICFIPDGDTRGFLRGCIGAALGQIVDEDGAVVGSHDGAFQYTVGQRRGLHIPRPHQDGAPRYVVGTDAETNTVFVAPRQALTVTEIQAGPAVNWLTDPTRLGLGATGEGKLDLVGLTIQFRAHGQPVTPQAVHLESSTDGTKLQVALPPTAGVTGVAPGQSLVLYQDSPQGDRVIAQATITATDCGPNL